MNGGVGGLSFILLCITTFLGIKIDKMLRENNVQEDVIAKVDLALIVIEIAVAVVNLAIFLPILFS